MTTGTGNKCLSCYDTGEIVTESGPVACPDCAGEPGAVSPWHQTERRLRDIEQRHAGVPDVDADLTWLVFELRRSRGVLLQVLARCQDAGDDELAREIHFVTNEALGLYPPRPS